MARPSCDGCLCCVCVPPLSLDLDASRRVVLCREPSQQATRRRPRPRSEAPRSEWQPLPPLLQHGQRHTQPGSSQRQVTHPSIHVTPGVVLCLCSACLTDCHYGGCGCVAGCPRRAASPCLSLGMGPCRPPALPRPWPVPPRGLASSTTSTTFGHGSRSVPTGLGRGRWGRHGEGAAVAMASPPLVQDSPSDNPRLGDSDSGRPIGRVKDEGGLGGGQVIG